MANRCAKETIQVSIGRDEMALELYLDKFRNLNMNSAGGKKKSSQGLYATGCYGSYSCGWHCVE